ncbi:hypothetical protein [Citrobacter amalonaticus]|nr:hypothetical protein [Citrobacter amalonaticus]
METFCYMKFPVRHH